MMRRISTLAAPIADALRRALGMRKVRAEQPLPKFPTFRGTGSRPGVDLDDSASLRDLMEER